MPFSDELLGKLSGNSFLLRWRLREAFKSSNPETDPVAKWYRTRTTRTTRCSARLAMKEFSMKLPNRPFRDMLKKKNNCKIRFRNEVVVGKTFLQRLMIARHPDFDSYLRRSELTLEETKTYFDTILPSEGFDAPILPLMFSSQIYPLLEYNAFTRKKMRFALRLAVKKYEEDEGKRLEVIEVSKANFQGWAPRNYYITFKARDMDDKDGDIKEYQTLFFNLTGGHKSLVQFVRLKPEKKREWDPEDDLPFWLV